MSSSNAATQPATRFDWERVIRRANLPTTTKLVALLLATYADQDGTNVHPGVERLARVVGQSTRSVEKHLDKLRTVQLVVRTTRANRYLGLADEYRLTVPLDLSGLDLLDPNENQRQPKPGSGDSPDGPVDNPGINRTAVRMTGDDTPGGTRGSPELQDGVNRTPATESPEPQFAPPTHLPTKDQTNPLSSPNVVQKVPVDNSATETEIDAEMTTEHAHRTLIARHGTRVHDVIAQHEARCDCADAARHLVTAPALTVIPGGKTA